MDKTDILLPCPFCGGEEEILCGHERDIPPYFYGRCKMCGSRSEAKFSKEEAITACNRRYEQPNEPLFVRHVINEISPENRINLYDVVKK